MTTDCKPNINLFQLSLRREAGAETGLFVGGMTLPLASGKRAWPRVGTYDLVAGLFARQAHSTP